MIGTRSQHRRDGFVLLAVLGAVLLLSTLLFGFARTARTSLGRADSFYRTEQARNGAWGGLQAAVAAVRDINAVGADPRSALPAAQENTLAVGDVNCCVVIAEENGLLNVNRLQGTDGQPDRRRVEQFLRLIDVLNRRQGDLPPIGYGIVPAIIDWVDRDEEPTHLPFVQHDNLGAEDDFYRAQSPPRSCRNGPIDTLEELLQVRGMTPVCFRRLPPYPTCVGDGKIDVNAAPKAVLQSLSEEMDATVVEMIVRQRRLKPFQDVAELWTVPGLADALSRTVQDLLTVNPAERFYRVTSRGRMVGHECTIEALLRRNTRAGTVDILQYRES